MKPILSLLLSAALLLTGCGQTAGSSPSPSGRTLAQPVYPEFPAYPSDGDGDYFQQLDLYYEAVSQIQGDALTASVLDPLNRFAGTSTALALADVQGENAIYSPVSLWAALAMLAQCADGDSRDQVLQALGADSVQDLQDQVSRVWSRLYTDDGTRALLLANSIWLDSARQGTYVQDTLDILAEKYFSGVYAVPMGTGEADAAVSDWVSRQTNGLIGSDEPVVQTDPMTLALLVSSLYYRAGWTDPFQASLTQAGDFTDSQGQTSQADFMHQTTMGNWLRTDTYQAAALGTNLGEMVFVLPAQGTAPEDLLRDPEFLRNLDFGSSDSLFGEIDWSVPKFDADSTLPLLETLEQLGITDLLDGERADLSALTDLSAVLSDAKQISRVKVDEEGVEAASVTILEIKETALFVPDSEVCVMDLNRPFLFVIRTQGVPLFVGVVHQV